MQKTLFTILLLFIIISGFAQDNPVIYEDTLAYHALYHVSKSNRNIKEGQYMLLRLQGDSHEAYTIGYYKNNLKDSVWREYDAQQHLLSEGRYKDGKRVGEWLAYDNREKLLSKYDFDHDTLLYFGKTGDEKNRKYPVVNAPGDTLFTVLDNPPFFLEGQSVVYRDLQFNLRIPHLTLISRTDGKSIINVTVDEHGHISNYSIAKLIGYGMEEEVIKNLKLLPADWMPGKLHGKNVTSVIQIPVQVHFLKM
jgi:hypothetical protein